MSGHALEASALHAANGKVRLEAPPMGDSTHLDQHPLISRPPLGDITFGSDAFSGEDIGGHHAFVSGVDYPLGTSQDSSDRRVLYLFSGPVDRADSLAAFLLEYGVQTQGADIVNLHLGWQDVADDSVWNWLRHLLCSGAFRFVFSSPPCRTFSECRSLRPGPPHLRDWEFPYGFPKSQASARRLSPSHFEQLRTDNMLAERVAEASSIIVGFGGGYATEQPRPWQGSVGMFDLQCFKDLSAAGARIAAFDQCMFGAPCRKPTSYLYGGPHTDFSDMDSVFCNHPVVDQVSIDGQAYLAAHPSFAGRRDAGTGRYATSTLSAYPTGLNSRTAYNIARAVDAFEASSSIAPVEPIAAQGHVDTVMAKQSSYFGSAELHRSYDLAGPTSLSTREVRNAENDVALGGMRRPDLSVAQSIGYQAGHCILTMAEKFVDDNPGTLQVAEDLRAGRPVTGFQPGISESFRHLWFQSFGCHTPSRMVGPDADVFECWGRATGDLDASTCLPQWLRHGAPLGIIEHITPAGVFPSVSTDDPLPDPESLYSDLAGWTNYASAEDEPGVVADLLEAQEQKGHCKFFDSMPELCEFLDVSSVVLTKLALITKEKADGNLKHRLIWDLLRSYVNSSVLLPERIVLPRVQDAVDDAADLLRMGYGGLEWLVLDIADAFHNVPLRPSERRYCCGKVGNRFVVFLVLCMGGKSSPNIWGRYAACIGRILASIFDPAEFRSEIYVDDPLLAVAGTAERRTRVFTMALLSLECLGFPLAWAKGVLGTDITWIGARFSTLRTIDMGIRVSIPDDKIKALVELISELRRIAVAPRKSVRSFCGKLSFVGGMLPYIRPFLAMFWAALSSKSSLPPALIHCRQFRVPLDWLHALFNNIHGPLVRDFPLWDVIANEGDYIATDACPWGFAGVLFKDYLPVAWFATPLTSHDLRRFQAKRGDCRHNTTWEALGLLVAIRLWLPGTKVLARVRSDSLSALRSMVKLSSSSPALNLIARELALDAVQRLYTVGVAVHIPGVSNKLPDDLSRMWAPDAHSFPECLRGIPEHIAPDRDRRFWKTMAGTHRRGHAQQIRSRGQPLR